MILNCRNLSKSFIVEELLKDVSFFMNKGDKVAIVGANGTGKTTLFRMITGELLPDSGEVTIASGTTIGYLKQNALSESGHSLYDQVYHANQRLVDLTKELEDLEEKLHSHLGDAERLERLNLDYHNLRTTFENLDGYQYGSLVRGVLKGLGFTEDQYEKPVAKLSGGQKTRVALAMELIRKPDILMLDEPTNHLDIDAITWLEGYLQAYRGTLLIISHDRYFLDQVTNITIELEFGTAHEYRVKYSDFMVQKEKNRAVQKKQYDMQQKEIKKQEEVIRKLKSFNREKSIKRAESREKQLDKVERLKKPMDANTDMHLKLVPRVESGFDVLSVDGLAKSFGALHLFDHLNFEIKKGDKTALIGDNGTGKSTMLKIINRLLDADAGSYKLGAKVKVGYYDQEHQLLDPNNTLMQEINDAYPALTDGEIRNILAGYLFQGDDVFKKVGTLSGGEKGRLTLVKLMLSEANFLILDEPTNHLDMVSKAILEKALQGYEGTLLFISHDRYFVNQVATRILHLGDSGLTSYLGNYDDYMEKKQLLHAPSEMTSVRSESETKNNWQEEKARKAAQRKLENQLAKVEAEIAELESTIEVCEEDLTKEEIYSDHAKAQEAVEKKEAAEAALETLYETWDELQEALQSS